MGNVGGKVDATGKRFRAARSAPWLAALSKYEAHDLSLTSKSRAAAASGGAYPIELRTASKQIRFKAIEPSNSPSLYFCLVPRSAPAPSRWCRTSPSSGGRDRRRWFGRRRYRHELGVLLRLLVRALLLLEFAPFHFGELFFWGGLPPWPLASNSALRLAFGGFCFFVVAGGAMVVFERCGGEIVRRVSAGFGASRRALCTRLRSGSHWLRRVICAAANPVQQHDDAECQAAAAWLALASVSQLESVPNEPSSFCGHGERRCMRLLRFISCADPARSVLLSAVPRLHCELRTVQKAA